MTGSRTLLVLAGYSGVGKTRLTDWALSHRAPIFGRSFSETFLALKRPRNPDVEAGHRGASALRPLTLFDVVRVDCSRLRDVVLLHLDLLSVVTAPFLIEDPVFRDRIFPRVTTSLMVDDENAILFDALLAHRFFRSFDAVAVNTLVAPWSVNAEQWLGRLRGGAPKYPQLLDQRRRHFQNTKQGPSVHRAVHSAWFGSLGRAALAWSALSWFERGRLRITPAPLDLTASPVGLFQQSIDRGEGR